MFTCIEINKVRLFYVGKGCDKRAYSQRERSSKWFEEANGGYWVEIVAQELNESTALLVEQCMIKGLNPGLVNSSEVSEVVNFSRYTSKIEKLSNKVDKNYKKIEANKEKIRRLKNKIGKLELTRKEKEFISSDLATLPAKNLSVQELSFRGEIANKLKERKKLVEELSKY